MKALAFAPMHNADGKKDATGAFHPEARRFLHVHEQPKEALVLFDNNLKLFKQRRQQVLDALAAVAAAGGGLECVTFFCHGWYGASPAPRSGIQAGFDRGSAKLLAEAMRGACVPTVTVPLYCCSTGDGTEFDSNDRGAHGSDGGFADVLRDELCKAGLTHCRVIGHDTVGHTTMNPYVVDFQGQGSPVGGNGGQWIVTPKSPQWGRWARALKTDLRFTFPFKSVGEVHAELAR